MVVLRRACKIALIADIFLIALLAKAAAPLGALCVPLAYPTSRTAQQAQTPDWCKSLPHLEYKSLERIQTSDPWFEVYKVAPQTFALYEPHQFEEVISYLILGKQAAILFDTGMGISDIHKVVSELTPLPIIVLNSHTHNDHVGGNWQFDTIYGMDTDFTRQNAQGSSADAQDELAPGQVCGDLPKGFDAKTYRTKPWSIIKFIQDGEVLDLGGREVQVIATPGHTPDSICLLDSAAGLLFTGDTFYPAPIWLYRPETDLAAYESSVLRLELEARNVKLVLGAHNIPVAPSSVLPKLAVAASELQSLSNHGKGKGHCKPSEPGKKTCKVGDFTFLLHATP